MSDPITDEQLTPNTGEQANLKKEEKPVLASPEEIEKDIEKFTAHLNHLKGIRLLAYRRLSLHNRFATWTVALVSVALIIGAIWKPLQLPIRVEAPIVDVVQVFFAFLVLVYSLLLSLENFGLLSERMYVAYEDLNRLSTEMSEHKARYGSIDSTAFANFIRQLITIMKDKPVPANIDARRIEIYMFVRERSENPKAVWQGRNYKLDAIRTVARYNLEFVHYLIVIALVLVGTFVPLCFPLICEPLQEPYIPG